MKKTTKKRNVLKNGLPVNRIVFLTHDRCYINIDVNNLDFSDLETGEFLVQWLYAHYLEQDYSGKIIKDFRWSSYSFMKDKPYTYSEYIGYSFHGDTDGYERWKD